MTTINGVYHHNVEDILASIRTSIADEAGATRLVSGEIHMPMHHPFQTRRDAQPPAEEAAEFELPAIFKPGHHAAIERPKLFGRLSEALKTNAPQDAGRQDAGRTRTVIPFDPTSANGAANGVANGAGNGTANGASNGRMIEPPAALQMAAASSEPNHYRHQPEPAKHEVEEVARVMPSFFDTRLNKLGEMSREVYKPKAPEPVPQPQPVPAPVYRQPPTLPQGNLAQQHANNAVDDAAAQLLRPMLRHWLQENMPKIVEKALLSELQGDFSAPNPNDPNKPQR
jgi:cell pole-organizing protein PopZ